MRRRVGGGRSRQDQFGPCRDRMRFFTTVSASSPTLQRCWPNRRQSRGASIRSGWGGPRPMESDGSFGISRHRRVRGSASSSGRLSRHWPRVSFAPRARVPSYLFLSVAIAHRSGAMSSSRIRRRLVPRSGLRSDGEWAHFALAGRNVLVWTWPSIPARCRRHNGSTTYALSGARPGHPVWRSAAAS